MGISFSIPQFLKVAADTYAGSMQGLQAGQQQAQRQQMEQFTQAMQAAQFDQSEQDRQYQMLSKLPMTDQSQADLAQSMVNQPNPLAGLAGSPVARRNPALAAVLPHSVAPAAPGVPAANTTPWPQLPKPGQAAPVTASAAAPGAPATPTATGGQPTFTGPGGVKLTMRGVDPKAAQKTLAALEQLRKTRAQTDLSGDPTTQASVDALLSQAPTEIKSPEDMQRAQEVLGRVTGPLGQYSRSAQQLGEGKLKSDAKDYEDQISAKSLGTMSNREFLSAAPGLLQMEDDLKDRRGKRGYPEKMGGSREDIAEMQRLEAAGQPDAAEELAGRIKGRLVTGGLSAKDEGIKLRNAMAIVGRMDPGKLTPGLQQKIFDQAGIGYMLPEGAPSLGGAAMRKELNGDMALIPRYKDLDPASQKALLDRIGFAAQNTDEPMTLPASIVAQMSPYQQGMLGIAQGRLKLQGSAQEIAKAREVIAQRHEDFMEKYLPQKLAVSAAKGAAGGPGLSPNHQASGLRADWASKDLQYNRLFTAKGSALFGRQLDFDPAHPKAGDAEEAKAAQMYQAKEEARQAYMGFLFKGGQEQQGGQPQNASAPATGTTQAQPGQSGFQPPAGMTAQQYRQNAYARGAARGWSPAQVNAFLRYKGAM